MFCDVDGSPFGRGETRIRSMVRSADDMDDVTQEVVLKVWLHLSTFRGGVQLSHLDDSRGY
jgi:hypothetical protein